MAASTVAQGSFKGDSGEIEKGVQMCFRNVENMTVQPRNVSPMHNLKYYVDTRMFKFYFYLWLTSINPPVNQLINGGCLYQ